MALAKNPFFYRLIHTAIESYGETHHITARQHFAPALGYSGENGNIQLSTALNYTTYNPAAPKAISVDQLYVLLDELGESRHIILDGIAKEFGGVFRRDIKNDVEHDNVRDELLHISGLSGTLTNKFLEYVKNDGIIDSTEAEELQHLAFEVRKQLSAFEDMINKVTQE